MQVISPEAAASLIASGSRIVTGGFGSCGHPDCLTEAVRNRFLRTGEPRNLKLLFAAGSGDRAGRGLDRLAIDGLLREVIGGFWGLCPELGKLAKSGRIDAHNWPQGVVSSLFTEIAAKRPGILTKIGLGTFVDPRRDGGIISSGACTPLVEVVELYGEEYLFYPSMPIDFALLRGTSVDPHGNIYFCEETSYMDALAQAISTRNSGGVIIFQVKRTRDRGRPQQVRVPGPLVDYVVVSDDIHHPQTYGHHYEASFIDGPAKSFVGAGQNSIDCAHRIIADRAALELRKHPGAHVNLGIGIPALIGARAAALGLDDFTLTVESGLFGGIPAQGLSFGASSGPLAVVEQSALFSYYDGGGIDVAFLGFGEVDRFGNVNVSRLGERLPGSGGFINISQSAARVVFCGTFTSEGLRVSTADHNFRVICEGRIRKFVQDVAHLTFNAEIARKNKQGVTYITERCVFDLREGKLTLSEIAPGISIDNIRAAVDFDFTVSPDLAIHAAFARRESMS